jgi:hypothetical protein
MRTSTAVNLKTLLHWAHELPLDGQALHDHAARQAAIKLASVVNEVLPDEVTPAEIAEQWDQRKPRVVTWWRGLEARCSSWRHSPLRLGRWLHSEPPFA